MFDAAAGMARAVAGVAGPTATYSSVPAALVAIRINTLAAGQDVQHEMARQVMILPKDVQPGWFFLFFAWYFFVCRSCHFSGTIWKDSGWHERTRE